jgi:hypothetical protein
MVYYQLSDIVFFVQIKPFGVFNFGNQGRAGLCIKYGGNFGFRLLLFAGTNKKE